MISIENVSLTRRKQVLFEDFSWKLPDPGLYLLLGGNNSGKSLVCSLLAGNLRPQKGKVICDGEPLYRYFGAMHQSRSLFWARAEDAFEYDETVEDYIKHELLSFTAGNDHFKGTVRMLEDRTEINSTARMTNLSHSQVLLVQLVLAFTVPARLVLMDDHLTYLDSTSCGLVSAFNSVAPPHLERFIILTASRLARPFPAADGVFILDEGLPVRIQSLEPGVSVDTAIIPHRQSGVLRVYTTGEWLQTKEFVSGRNFTLLARLEDGLRIKPTGTLDGLVAEFSEQGLQISAIEWE